MARPLKNHNPFTDFPKDILSLLNRLDLPIKSTFKAGMTADLFPILCLQDLKEKRLEWDHSEGNLVSRHDPEYGMWNLSKSSQIKVDDQILPLIK